MSPAIEEQLRSAEIEAIGHDREASALRERIRHQETAYASTVEEMVSAVLDVYRNVTRLADLVAAASDDIREAWAPKVVAHFMKICANGREVLPDLEWAVAQGHPISKADEFRQAVDHAQVLSSNADRWLAAIKQLDEGRGVPLQEAMNELRRRAGAGRS